MTKQEKQTFKKIMECLKNPSVPFVSYDENMRRTEEPQLVEGTANTDLLSDPRFKAGWEQCYKNLQQYATMLFASSKDQVRFAGKPK